MLIYVRIRARFRISVAHRVDTVRFTYICAWTYDEGAGYAICAWTCHEGAGYASKVMRGMVIQGYAYRGL